MPTGPRVCLAALAASLLLTASTRAAESPSSQDWLQWRGNARDSISQATDWPDGLSAERLETLWRTDLGPSYSGPIVSGDRVFVTETVNEKTEHVRAFDRNTGKQLWEASWPGSMQVSFIGASAGSWIRSTPACDGNSLFVLGMRDVLVALDVATGKENWRVDFPKTFGSPVPDFGGVSSPMVVGDHVFAQAGSGVVKLDKATGKVVWRTIDEGGGKSINGAFSSLMLATIHGKPQLLMQGREVLTGISPESGKVLWKMPVPAMFGMNIATPTVHSNAVFASSLGGSLLLDVSADDPPAVKTRWRNKTLGDMSSPIIIDGHIYTHLRNGQFACLNIADGATRWTSPVVSRYNSMVAQGKRILALSETGQLRLLAATPDKYDVLGTVRVNANETWAHLAVAGEQIFVRDLNGLTAYRWK